MVDVIDGTLNLIGMIFYLITLCLIIYIYMRNKKITYIFLALTTIGGIMFTLGNVLEKFAIIAGATADTLGEIFGLFFGAMLLVTGLVAVFEQTLRKQ